MKYQDLFSMKKKKFQESPVEVVIGALTLSPLVATFVVC